MIKIGLENMTGYIAIYSDDSKNDSDKNTPSSSDLVTVPSCFERTTSVVGGDAATVDIMMLKTIIGIIIASYENTRWMYSLLGTILIIVQWSWMFNDTNLVHFLNLFLSDPTASKVLLCTICYFGTMCFQIQVYDCLGTYGFPNGIVKLP